MDSERDTNQAPDTFITSGPRNQTETSYFVRIAWRGEDADGFVKGFNLTVDGSAEFFVTGTDSTFSFLAPNQSTSHTITVAAVDDREEVDPSPAELSFTATNVAPNTAISIEGDPAPGSTFGRGGVFKARAVDDPDNGPEYAFRYKLDASAWSEWFASEENNFDFEFSINSQLGLLPVGNHTLFAQTRDVALAVDETPAEFDLVVSDAVRPLAALDSTLFNGEGFFEDNSVFAGVTEDSVKFDWSVSFDYAGAVSLGSRYRLDGGTWTEYSTTLRTLTVHDVAPGAHSFEVQYRDLAGTQSDIAVFDFDVVRAQLNQGLLVVDDGDGVFAGSPEAVGEMNVDGFYTEMFNDLGATFTLWDIYKQGNPTPGRGMGNYSTILWQSDESALRVLPLQTAVVGKYLLAGGNLWIHGWRPIHNLGGQTPVLSFAPAPFNPANYAFIWEFLKISSTRQSPGSPPEFIGATGDSGHPDVNVDPQKNFIPAFENRLPIIDSFTLRNGVEGVEAIYTFESAFGSPDFQGSVVGMKYLGDDFKVVALGFPFYHLMTEEAREAARVILTELGEL